MRNGLKMDNIRVVRKIFGSIRNKVQYAFDGQKNLYCGRELAINTNGVTRVVVIQLDGFQEQTFEVKFKFANQVFMDLINDYLGGTLLNATSEQFRESIQVIEIMLRYITQQTRVPVGRSLYPKTDRQSI